MDPVAPHYLHLLLWVPASLLFVQEIHVPLSKMSYNQIIITEDEASGINAIPAPIITEKMRQAVCFIAREEKEIAGLRMWKKSDKCRWDGGGSGFCDRWKDPFLFIHVTVSQPSEQTKITFSPTAHSIFLSFIPFKSAPMRGVRQMEGERERERESWTTVRWFRTKIAPLWH